MGHPTSPRTAKQTPADWKALAERLGDDRGRLAKGTWDSNTLDGMLFAASALTEAAETVERLEKRLAYIPPELTDSSWEDEAASLRSRLTEIEGVLREAVRVMVEVNPAAGDNWKIYAAAIDAARALLSPLPASQAKEETK